MEIEYVQAKTLKEKPAWDQNLGFGKYFTDYMFTMDWTVNKGWQDVYKRQDQYSIAI